MKWTGLRIAPLLLTLGALACEGGTETGNPPFDAKLSYAAYSTRPEAVEIGSASAQFDVAALWLTVSDVRFIVSGTCSDAHPETRSAPGLGTDNRAVGDPKTTRFTMYPGRYCGLDVPFEPAGASLPVSAPAELSGHALMIEGTLASGTVVSILGDAPPVALSAAGSDFAMQESEPNILVAFDVAKWFDGLDFSSAVQDGSTVHVTKEQNAALFGQFQSRVAAGVQLFRDVDGDGRVDPGSVPIATGR